jgi:TPR repeat protein
MRNGYKIAVSDVEDYKIKALKGDVLSQKALADFYCCDIPIDDVVYYDKEEAYKWVRMAADQGDAEALFMLSCYQDDENERFRLLELSADQGYIEAMDALGHFYSHVYDYDQAISWFKKEFELTKNSFVAYDIGMLYIGRLSDYTDYRLGILWYKKAIDLGNSFAAFSLAKHHEMGFKNDFGECDLDLINQPDIKEASKWYLKSAEMGYSEAQYKYAKLCYEGNESVTKNYRKAFYWMFRAACRAGIWSYPIKTLSNYYMKGIGTARSIYESYIWSLMSASNFSEYVSELEALLCQDEIHAAQDEAEIRREILDDENLDPKQKLHRIKSREFILDKILHGKEDTNPKNMPKETQTSIISETDNPRKVHRSGLDLSTWNVKKISDIKLTFYLKDANITLSYGNHSVTKPADKLFSEKSLRLLKMAYDFFTQGHPKIKYHDRTLNTRKGTELQNNRIVTYFNSDFRQIFGLSKKVRAFDWSGSKFNRILVKNFDLIVQ